MIALGCDHGGFELKQVVINMFNEKNISYKDFGVYDTDSADYPDYALKAANAVVSGECQKGLLFCGTGIGISIAANKVKGIRCAVCSEPFSAIMSRKHNNTNMLALGGRVVGPDLALMIVEAWLNTEFESGGRHEIRVGKIHNIESC